MRSEWDQPPNTTIPTQPESTIIRRCHTRGVNSKQLPVLLCNLKNDRAKYYKSPLLSTLWLEVDGFRQTTTTICFGVTKSQLPWAWLSQSATTLQPQSDSVNDADFNPSTKFPHIFFKISCVLCSTMRFGSGAPRPGGRLKLFVTLLGPFLSCFLWCGREAFSSRGDQCIHLALKYKAFLYPQRKIPA